MTSHRACGPGARLVLALALAMSACRRLPAEPPIDLVWTLDPTPARVGPAALIVTLREEAGAPVRGATVRLEAHMSHPGMAPILATATESAPGVYRARLDLTMAGDWVVLLDATRPDGRRVERRIDLPPVRPAS